MIRPFIILISDLTYKLHQEVKENNISQERTEAEIQMSLIAATIPLKNNIYR